MQLYNSRTQTVEDFIPLGTTATVYVCGVTPYDTTHLGHAFTYVMFDALIRYLEANGQPVRYVQNVTDIDDDVLKRAAKVGMGWRELGEQETEKFLTDLRALNVRMPDVYPKATEEIAGIIDMARELIEQDYAYERNGNVYFSVKKDPNFGQLSRYDYATMLTTANERGNFPDDPNKNDPLDFVLWQAAKEGEPTWTSPWGEGRPGWHIECSVMGMRHLGPQIDIHGGGADLLFPHHECEIAQSEHYSALRPFVNIWMHTGMVRMDGEKMSKSLGNMVFVQKLREQYSSDAIRAYLFNSHYRTAFEWAESDMETAAQRAARWQAALKAEGASGGGEADVTVYVTAFHQAMQNDLDTPNALRALDAIATLIQAEQGDLRAAQAHLREVGGMMGLTFQS